MTISLVAVDLSGSAPVLGQPQLAEGLLARVTTVHFTVREDDALFVVRDAEVLFKQPVTEVVFRLNETRDIRAA